MGRAVGPWLVGGILLVLGSAGGLWPRLGWAQPTLDAVLADAERTTTSLLAEVGPSRAGHCTFLLRDAGLVVHVAPLEAGAMFEVISRLCPQQTQAVPSLLDSGRVAVAVGARETAQRYFAQAARRATAAHEVAPAVEILAQLLVAAGRVDALPPLEKYIERVGFHGRLDDAGYETIYLIARTLVRSRDARAAGVLALIPEDAGAARRSRYLLGVAQLQQGAVARARELFLAAAEKPLARGLSKAARDRERRVVEMAWMAVGRLAFEAGDAPLGYYAYQQVVLGSPNFPEAFLELGWLAMESGDPEVALTAFEPLISLDPGGRLGRRAELLKGFAMLYRKQYDAAQHHYQAVADQYEHEVAVFEREIGAIKNPSDLTRNCQVRYRAQQSPHLSLILANRHLRAARRLDAQLSQMRAQQMAGKAELETIQRLRAGQGHFNPLHRLAAARARASRELARLMDLGKQLGRRDAAAGWQASLTMVAATGGCPGGEADGAVGDCVRRREQLASLRGRLERLVTSLQQMEDDIRRALEMMGEEWEQVLTDHERAYLELSTRAGARRSHLVQQAVAESRWELQKMAMEGHAGVLEAIWRFKEDHRQRIGALEQERKRLLGQLETQFLDALAELEETERVPY